MHAPLSRALIICTLLAHIATAEASARCTDSTDLSALGDALTDDINCRMNVLMSGGSPCPTPSFPACAGTTPEQIATLLLGQEPGPVLGWTPTATRCQQAIALFGSRFARKRLIERGDDQRRAKSGRVMKRIQKTCSKTTVEQNQFGDDLVRVGAPCSSVLGSPGESIDGTRLARCLRAAIEGEIDEIAPSALQPNIVVIMTDDQRRDTFEVMPTVSALRDESISFSNAFVTNPVCTPSRASLLTGRYSHNTGVLDNGDFAQLDDSDTIATWLASAGYTTALMGKYVNNSELLGLAPPAGWDEWKSFLSASGGEFYSFRINDNGVEKKLGSGRYSTDWMGSQAVKFIRRQARDPFFVLYTPYAPHGPSLPAHKYENEFTNYPLHRPPSWFDDVSDKPTWVKFYKSIADPALPAIIDETRLDQLRTLLSVDDAVEHILTRLERLDLTDNTIVVFTSDHGFLWGEHWLSSKFNPYEESIRVPYSLRYPRRYPLPGTRDQMVLNHDLAPTLAELAGAPIPPDLDGVSLVPLLDSASAPWRDEFLIETEGEFITSPSVSVRTETFKYIDTDFSGGVTEELYDIVADPHERTNLASDPAYAAVLADMTARLDALRP